MFLSKVCSLIPLDIPLLIFVNHHLFELRQPFLASSFLLSFVLWYPPKKNISILFPFTTVPVSFPYLQGNVSKSAPSPIIPIKNFSFLTLSTNFISPFFYIPTFQSVTICLCHNPYFTPVKFVSLLHFNIKSENVEATKASLAIMFLVVNLHFSPVVLD